MCCTKIYGGNMTDKEQLEYLIKNGGNCDENIECFDCIISGSCNFSTKENHELALKEYLTVYGTENLMEILL
jgi:hypothetical protein